MDKDTVYLNEYVVKALRVPQDYIETEKLSQIKKLAVETYSTDQKRKNTI